jgi:hypothetical protein
MVDALTESIPAADIPLFLVTVVPGGLRLNCLEVSQACDNKSQMRSSIFPLWFWAPVIYWAVPKYVGNFRAMGYLSSRDGANTLNYQ